MHLKIYFENSQKKEKITYSMKLLIRAAILETLKHEDYRRDAEISLTFVDNEGIHALNKQYRNIDRPTDVLSFPLFESVTENDDTPEGLDVMLGDIVLSLERAREQAEEYGHSFCREVAFLCVHSVLHLLGYDHERSEEEDKDMRCRQSAIMDKLGLSVNTKNNGENDI